MLVGLRRKSPSKLDVLTPISFHLLNRLIHSLSGVCNSQYEARLFSSAFSIAYFAMLRVSELAVKSSSNESGHALNYENVKLTKTMAKMNYILKSKVQNPTKDTIRLPLSFRNNQSQIFVIFNYCNPTLTCAFPGTNGSKKLYVHFNDSGGSRGGRRGRYSVLLLSI